MKENTYKYDDDLKRFKIKFLEQIDYFNEYFDGEDLLNDIQFHLKEKKFTKDMEIIASGDVCAEIIFINQGKVLVEIHKADGECWELDTLRHGDIIGLNSILDQSTYWFNATAEKSVRVYSLDIDFFDTFKTKIKDLDDVLENARDERDPDEIIIKDYQIHPKNMKKKQTQNQAILDRQEKIIL